MMWQMGQVDQVGDLVGEAYDALARRMLVRAWFEDADMLEAEDAA